MVLVLVFIMSSSLQLGLITGAQDGEETVLRMGFTQRIDNLNPMAGLSDASYIFYGLVYDAFSTVENDFDAVGNLATDYRIVSQAELDELGDNQIYGSVWEYTLSTNATWHDGEPFTVWDAVWWINLQADESYYEMMWAFQPYMYFVHHAEAIDGKTIRIHFYDRGLTEAEFPESSIPCSYAYNLCMPMLPKHKLDDMSANSIAFEWSGVFPLEEDGPPIIGTGPFMATENIYQEWIIGDHITLIRNPDYHWGVERNMYVNFDKIIMYFYDDAYELNLALQIGQVDIAALPPYTYSALKDSVQGGSVSDIHCQDGLKCTQYWTEIGFCMNEDGGRNKARLDPEVRKALAMAIDKDVIVNTYYAGLAEPGTTLISSVNEEWHYEPTAEELIPYDLDGARQLLEDAGYRDTNADGIREVTADSLTYDMGWEVVGEPLSFEMLIRHEFPEEGEIANYLRDQWYSIGVDLEYDIYDEVTFSAIVYSYDYDSMIWYWSADPDPNFMLFGQAAQSIDGWSDNMYDNPDYQENYMLSITTMDPVDRKVYTDNCQRIAYEDCAYILLAYVYQTYAWRTDTFEGWGDWDANPCLSLDHFWTGPQLMFELEPIGESPPNTTSEVDGVVGQNGWYRSNVTVTLEATDGSGSFNRTLYSLDDSDWLTYEDPIEVTGDGEHVLMYYSVDDDGLTEPNNTLDLNIDTVDPSLTIDVSEGTTFDTDEVNISWESSDEGSGIAITEYLLDGEEYVPCADCYVVLTDLEEGEHNLTVRVHDEAGNNVSDTVQFVVDIPDEGMSTLAIAAAVSAAAVLGAAAFVYWTGRRKRGPLSPD